MYICTWQLEAAAGGTSWRSPACRRGPCWRVLSQRPVSLASFFLAREVG